MYVPGPYVADDPRAIVGTYPFAQLVTATADGPFATVMPIYFETDDPNEHRLIGHLARANPHAEALRTGQPALAIFSGPHAYISASWYQERRSVPTWNYLSAQVRGPLEVIDEPDAQIAILRRSAEIAERGCDTPWTLGQAPPDLFAALLGRIRSFRIPIATIEGATKLSQAQPPGDRVRVWQALEERGTGDDLAVAALMRRCDSA